MIISNSDFEFFKNELPKFLNDHNGQYVLIKNEAVIGFFPSIEEALKTGYEKFGNADFLIQEITDENRVNYINSAFIASSC